MNAVSGCVVVKTDPVVYAFLWDGIFVLVGQLRQLGCNSRWQHLPAR